MFLCHQALLSTHGTNKESSSAHRSHHISLYSSQHGHVVPCRGCVVPPLPGPGGCLVLCPTPNPPAQPLAQRICVASRHCLHGPEFNLSRPVIVCCVAPRLQVRLLCRRQFLARALGLKVAQVQRQQQRVSGGSQQSQQQQQQSRPYTITHGDMWTH